MMEGHSAHSLHSFMSHVTGASHAHRGPIQPRPPFIVTATLYRDLRASSFRLTFRLLPPLTDNHAPSSGSPLSPPQSSVRPPWRPFPCSPFQNRSPRSLHHPRSVSANIKRCKRLQSGGGAGRNPSPCMFEVSLCRLAVPPFFNAYKNNQNQSVWMYLIPVLLAQRCAFTKISPLLTYTHTHTNQPVTTMGIFHSAWITFQTPHKPSLHFPQCPSLPFLYFIQSSGKPRQRGDLAQTNHGLRFISLGEVLHYFCVCEKERKTKRDNNLHFHVLYYKSI